MAALKRKFFLYDNNYILFISFLGTANQNRKFNQKARKQEERRVIDERNGY